MRSYSRNLLIQDFNTWFCLLKTLLFFKSFPHLYSGQSGMRTLKYLGFWSLFECADNSQHIYVSSQLQHKLLVNDHSILESWDQNIILPLQVAIGTDQISALLEMARKPGAERELDCQTLDASSRVQSRDSHPLLCRPCGN